jgi:hypothetical protein
MIEKIVIFLIALLVSAGIALGKRSRPGGILARSPTMQVLASRFPSPSSSCRAWLGVSL